MSANICHHWALWRAGVRCHHSCVRRNATGVSAPQLPAHIAARGSDTEVKKRAWQRQVGQHDERVAYVCKTGTIAADYGFPLTNSSENRLALQLHPPLRESTQGE